MGLNIRMRTVILHACCLQHPLIHSFVPEYAEEQATNTVNYHVNKASGCLFVCFQNPFLTQSCQLKWNLFRCLIGCCYFLLRFFFFFFLLFLDERINIHSQVFLSGMFFSSSACFFLFSFFFGYENIRFVFKYFDTFFFYSAQF